MKTKTISIVALISFVAMLMLGLFSCKKTANEEFEKECNFTVNYPQPVPLAEWDVLALGDSDTQRFSWVIVTGEGIATRVEGHANGDLMVFMVPVGQTYEIRWKWIGEPYASDGWTTFTPTLQDTLGARFDYVPALIY